MSQGIIIKLKIKNINEIASVFRKAPAKMTAELNRAIERIIIKIDNTAKREAPVSKQSGGGNLRQSISSRMLGVARGAVEVGASYAGYVHGGTRAHIIRIRNKKVLANKRTGRVFGKVVRHPGTRANPFLQRAVDKNNSFIDLQFNKAIENALK